jgi:hypothetical protein
MFEKLRELAEKATPGKRTALWFEDEKEWIVETEGGSVIASAYASHGFQGLGDERGHAKCNAEFIAAVDPQTVLGLLEKVDELECTLSDEEAAHQGTLRQVEVLKGHCQAALSFIENMTCPQTTADVALPLLKGSPVIDGLRSVLGVHPTQQPNPVPVSDIPTT